MLLETIDWDLSIKSPVTVPDPMDMSALTPRPTIWRIHWVRIDRF